MPDQLSNEITERGPSGDSPADDPAEEPEKEFDFSGGQLCLDFANTESERHLPTAQDSLEDYGDLVAWARQAEVIDSDEARGLRERAAGQLAAAEVVLGQARALRGAIYRLFSALASGQEVETADLVGLNTSLADLLATSRLVSHEGRFIWDWAGPADALERPLWSVARSAADLLTSPDLSDVRECASPTCTWLFVDTSRNHSRRWCDMKSCGNRAKARRHYERHRTS